MDRAQNGCASFLLMLVHNLKSGCPVGGPVYHPSNLINVKFCEISHIISNFFPYGCEIHHQKDNLDGWNPLEIMGKTTDGTSLGGRGPAPAERRLRLGLSFASRNGWIFAQPHGIPGGNFRSNPR